MTAFLLLDGVIRSELTEDHYEGTYLMFDTEAIDLSLIHISGKVNPSGKLAETFIRDASQCPAHTIGTFGKKDRVEYRLSLIHI